MRKEEELPLLDLYCYIYRNIRKGWNTNVVLSISCIIPYVKRVVHTAPKLIYTDIFKEMEKMKLIRLIGTDRCIILNNKQAEKRMKRLNEYVFPINPSTS